VWFAVTVLNAPGQRADPGVTVIMGGIGVAILGVALLVLVLRTLLAQAVARRRSGADAGRVGRSDLMPIAVDIDVMLARRKMSVGELADRVGITPANLAVLKNGRAKAVRFTTLAALCEVLECQPGDLLRWEAEDAAGG
jgi:putative transcriptional regulator